ncbi:MAG: hypothetical protein U5L95_02280 [Candidatus Saccharibacteria bacterium]|nr:hypothetical protein [Candidatus Saccharibacteria bacterium]
MEDGESNKQKVGGEGFQALLKLIGRRPGKQRIVVRGQFWLPALDKAAKAEPFRVVPAKDTLLA